MHKNVHTYLMPVLILLIAVSCVKENKEAAPVMLISKIGQVSLNTRGNELPASAVIRIGDTIITGEKSMASLLIPERSGIKIYENSEFIIARRDTAGNGTAADTQFSIDRGTVLLLIERLTESARFTVTTPTAVASVRGTSFLVAVDTEKNRDKGGTTGVTVVRGSVRVETKDNPRESRTVQQGGMVVVSNDTVVEEKKEIPDSTFNKLKEEENDLNTSISLEADGTESIPEKSAISPAKTPPVLKTERDIKEYYHKLEEINLDDGTRLIGAVIYQDRQVVKIHTANGVIQVPTSSIKNIHMR